MRLTMRSRCEPGRLAVRINVLPASSRQKGAAFHHVRTGLKDHPNFADKMPATRCEPGRLAIRRKAMPECAQVDVVGVHQGRK